MIKEISTTKLKDLLKNTENKNILFIDVRTKDEFEEHSINGFLNIPLDDIMNKNYDIDKNSEIYLLCRSGGRSAMAAEILKSHGIENVYNIAGGIINF